MYVPGVSYWFIYVLNILYVCGWIRFSLGFIGTAVHQSKQCVSDRACVYILSVYTTNVAFSIHTCTLKGDYHEISVYPCTYVYSPTALASTLIRAYSTCVHSSVVHTLHSVPSSCKLPQPVPIMDTYLCMLRSTVQS